jgi:hypothetical protein
MLGQTRLRRKLDISDYLILQPVFGKAEINRVAPLITPTLGAELVVNGTMEADSNWADFRTPTTNERSAAQKHAGTYSRHFICGASADGVNSDNFTTVTGTWYQIAYWHYPTVLTNQARFQLRKGDNSGYLFSLLGLTATTDQWNQIAATARELGGGAAAFLVLQSQDTANCYVDDASVKPITFSSTLSYLGSRSKRPGTYQCTPTVAANTQAGILLGYADANNFVMAIVNRVAGQAQLLKNISGTYTSVIAGAITYGAEKALKVIVASNGTDYSLYYDSVQVGSTTAINDAGLGTAVYGFNTYAGNTVGQVTTSGATS